MSTAALPQKLHREHGEELPNCNIEPAIVALLAVDPFYGYTIQGLRRDITDKIETLAVEAIGNFIYLRINPYFWNWAGQYSGIQTQMDLLRHEVGHLIRDHLFRRGNRISELWNIAADATINQWLVNLPKGCIYPETLQLPRDQTAEWYYDQLLEKQQQPQQQGSGQGNQDGQSDDQQEDGGGGQQGEGEPDDEQDGDGGGGDGEQDGDQESDGQGQGGLPDLSDHWHCDGHNWGTKDIEDSDPYYVQEEVKRLIEQSLERAIHEAPGTVPGNLIAQIEEALHKPKPWKRILRQFIDNATNQFKVPTRSRPNRRTGLINPGRRREFELKILCGYDTSASVVDEQLNQFMAEMDKIAEHSELYGCEFDTVCHDVFKWERGKRVEVKGRGGTDLTVPFAVAEDIKPDCLIIFTDGDGPIPEKKPRYPVLWVYTQIHSDAPWGKKVILEI